jgi:DNA-binding MarR family transcriptional regulator
MEEQWSELGKRHNITPAQQHILFLLSVNQSLTPSQISDLGCWHISTVTRLLKPLSAKGLICISPDPNRKKYKNISITKAGEHLFYQLVKSVKEMENFPLPLNRLSESEITNFLKYGQTILEMIKGKNFENKVLNAKIAGVDYN